MIKNDRFIQIEREEIVNIIKNADEESFENVMDAFGIKRGYWEPYGLREGSMNLAKVCLSTSAGFAEADTLKEDFAENLVEYFAFPTNIFVFLTSVEAYLSAKNPEDVLFEDKPQKKLIKALENNEIDENCVSYIESCTGGELYQIVRYLLSKQTCPLGYEWNLPILKRVYKAIPHGLLFASMAMSLKVFTDPFINLLNRL